MGDTKIKGFRNWVKADGSTDFPPESGRYHLYIQHLCPFAHRAMLGVYLKGLQACFTVDVVDFMTTEQGWRFSPEKPGCTADTVNGFEYLSQVYALAAKNEGFDGYEGGVTVPVLFDKKTKRIVNNESAEILRMLNEDFDNFCPTPAHKALKLYPTALQKSIDDINNWTMSDIVMPAYGGAAKTQEDYAKAMSKLWPGLAKAEEMLSKSRYLTGNQITEADIRLFVCLLRFDAVYAVLFMCTKKRIVDHPNLWAYTRDIYQLPGVRETVNMDHIMKGYYEAAFLRMKANPNKIVPEAPALNFDEPHGRDKFT